MVAITSGGWLWAGNERGASQVKGTPYNGHLFPGRAPLGPARHRVAVGGGPDRLGEPALASADRRGIPAAACPGERRRPSAGPDLGQWYLDRAFGFAAGTPVF